MLNLSIVIVDSNNILVDLVLDCNFFLHTSFLPIVSGKDIELNFFNLDGISVFFPSFRWNKKFSSITDE